MNDDLTRKQEDQPMDWRFRNILISYLMYYIFVITNFMNCVTLWTVFCIVTYVIIDDIWDSY